MPIAARKLLHRLAIHEIATVVRRPQLQQDLDKRGLACAGRADDPDRLAAVHLEVDVRQDRPTGAVRIRNIVEREREHFREGSFTGVVAARRIATLGLLQPIDVGEGLAEELVGPLDLIAVRSRSDEKQDDGPKRRDVAGTSSVKTGQTRDDDEENEALIEVRRQASEELGAEEEILSRADEILDPAALGITHAEHLGLLGNTHRLTYPAGIVHLRLRECARTPVPKRVQWSQKNEQQHGRTQDKNGSTNVEQQRRDDQHQEDKQRNDQGGQLQRALRRLHHLVGHHLLQVPLAIARLHCPGGACEGVKEFLAHSCLNVGSYSRRERRERNLQCEANNGEDRRSGQQRANRRVDTERADIHCHVRCSVDEASRDLRDDREDSGFCESREHRDRRKGYHRPTSTGEQRSQPRPHRCRPRWPWMTHIGFAWRTACSRSRPSENQYAAIPTANQKNGPKGILDVVGPENPMIVNAISVANIAARLRRSSMSPIRLRRRTPSTITLTESAIHRSRPARPSSRVM